MWALSWKGGNLSANWSSFTGEVFLALVVYSCWLPTPTSCSYNWDDQPVLCLECLPSHQEETSPKASWWLNWGNCLIHWSNQCLSLRLRSAPSGSLLVPFFYFFIQVYKSFQQCRNFSIKGWWGDSWFYRWIKRLTKQWLRHPSNCICASIKMQLCSINQYTMSEN